MAGKKAKVILLAGIITIGLLFGLGTADPEQAWAAAKTAVVTGSGINVRAGPGLSYRIVGAVDKGDRYTVLQQKNGWSKLQLTKKSTGWIKGTYLNLLNSGSPGQSSAQPAPAKTGKTVTVNNAYLNVRSGPGLRYAKVARVNKGAKLAVLKESDGWYKVALGDGRTGWLAGWLVTVKNNSLSGGSSGSSKDTGSGQSKGTSLIVKGSVVNVRSGAGTGFGVIAKVKAGDRLTVIKQSGEWYLAGLPGSKQGWIISRYTEPYPVDSSSGEERKPGSPSRSEPGDSAARPEPDEPKQTAAPDGPKPATEPDSGNAVPEPASEPPQPPAKLSGLELVNKDSGESSLAVKSEGMIKYRLQLMKEPARLVIDLDNCELNGLTDFTPGGTLVNGVRVAQYSLTPVVVRIVLDLNKPVSYKPLLGEDGKTLTVTLSEPSIKGKVIVVDPGHGGYDPGAIGVTGLEEKGFNLEAALLLREKLAGLGATVILTREGDSFMSLTERAAVANKVYADVFISIHANSSDDNASARGTSTYYYAPASNPELYAQLEQRKKMAWTVQGQLVSTLGTRDFGVWRANFAVLRGTAMPSVLVEAAFLSNQEDEALLRESQFRERTAQGIANGLVEYFANPL